MSAGDKAKDFFTKTKNLASRTTQKVMVKLGKADETVDIQFNQESERFANHYKAIKKLKQDTQKLLEHVKDFSIIQANCYR